MVRKMKTEKEIKDGEILFLYEGKLTNPNGDIDDENRPRMDYETFTNLVSDVRLKRYIRDYLLEKGNDIFIDHGDVKTASDRLNEVLISKDMIDILKDINKRYEFVNNNFIDIRLFGAMIPIAKEDKTNNKSGDSIKVVGPIQFSWGYSLNKVELLNSYSITAGFSSSGENKMNSIGKDYRLYYSLIGFYGVISSKRAAKTNLTSDDLRKFDDAVLKSLPSQASRSKINQMPVLYLRTESNGEYIGDLRDYIKFSIKNDPVRSINDYSIDISNLLKSLKDANISISKLWVHTNLDISNKDEIKAIKTD
jgi:CRISPR-associated protein Csh2